MSCRDDWVATREYTRQPHREKSVRFLPGTFTTKRCLAYKALWDETDPVTKIYRRASITLSQHHVTQNYLESEKPDMLPKGKIENMLNSQTRIFVVVIIALKCFEVTDTLGILLERCSVRNQSMLQPRIVRLLQKLLK